MSDTKSNPAGPSKSLASLPARYGLVFFTIYLLLYGGFVLLVTFFPALVEKPIGGISLAVVYGIGLILAAFLLALCYLWVCRTPKVTEQAKKGDKE